MDFEEKEEKKVIQDVVAREFYFRDKSGLSARELSLRLGKHDSYINKLESLGFVLPITVVYKMANEFGISKEEFFADDYKSYQKDLELYSLIKKLPDEVKESLVNLLRI